MADFDREAWEQRWEQALLQHGDAIANMPPNAHVVRETGGLSPARALDAGCGHGAESLWLAGRGWSVTALDFSTKALAQGKATADALGPDIAARVEWIEADLTTWAPEPAAFDLVVCIYVHIAGEPGEFVQRMASGVAPGGTLLMVGHLDAPGQRQVTLDDARTALDPSAWELLVAATQERTHGPAGTDAVIRARRI